MASDTLTPLDIVLQPDPCRTVVRPFDMAYPEGLEDGRAERHQVIAERLLAYDHDATREIVELILAAIGKNHRNAAETFQRRYGDLPEAVRALPASEKQRLLLGATFSEEYAFEAAALFNPSVVALSEEIERGSDVDFILSLRGVGEGHISSITFRRGTWRADGRVTVTPPSGQCVTPTIADGDGNDGATLVFTDGEDPSETVIFPVLPSQRKGIEDLRLVRFTDDDGSRHILGTYTAFDGQIARSELLRGHDFGKVEMRPLSGAMAGYKGMALFPRRIDGRFVMLGRQDNERIWLLHSDDLYRWDEGEPIVAPRYPWELVQMGNCGSPIEIDEGWLVITHGVGPLRSYCIGACLLDRDDPAKVLARTPEPLLIPSAEQHGGYVPNVVYSCGSLVRGRELLLPYGVGDRIATFATGTVDGVLAAMEPA